MTFAPLVLLLAAQEPAPLDRLDFLVGEWKAKAVREGRESTMSVTTRRRLQGTYLEMEETLTTKDAKPSTTIMLITWDAAQKSYQAFMFNSRFPTFPISMLGTLEGSKLTFKIDAAQSQAKASFIYEPIGKDRYRSSSTILEGTKETTDSVEYERVKPN